MPAESGTYLVGEIPLEEPDRRWSLGKGKGYEEEASQSMAKNVENHNEVEK